MYLAIASITLARVNDGAGIKSVITQYYLSDSNTAQTGGSWINTQPEWVSGKWIWERTRTALDDGTYSYSVPMLSKNLNTLYETTTDLGSRLVATETSLTNKIWQTDIATAITPLQEQTTELSDRQSSFEQSLDGITTSISSMQTQIDSKADDEEVTEISTQISELTQDLSGFKTTVETTYATKTSLSNAIKSVRSSITQQADEIELKVDKDGVISAINQTAETITIDASKIDLSGCVTVSAHEADVAELNNQISGLSYPINSAYGWVTSNGANMTALRSMVMKWTNDAVSDTTTIQGGWISTNTITADKIAVGLSGNIMPYGFDSFEMCADKIPNFGKSHISALAVNSISQYVRYGNYSMRIRTDGSNLCYVRFNDGTAYNGVIPVDADAYYIFSWYVRSPSHDSINMQGYAWQYDSTGEEQTGGFPLTKRTLDGCKSGWVRYTSAPFKPNCSQMALAMYIEDATTAVSLFIDCLQLEQVDSELQIASPWKPNQATIIDGGQITAGTVNTLQLAADSITAAKIAANAVTADKINVNSLEAVSANIGGFKIVDNAITSASTTVDSKYIKYLNTEISPTAFGILYDGDRTHGFRLKIEGLPSASTNYESALTFTGPGIFTMRTLSLTNTIKNYIRFSGEEAYGANSNLHRIHFFVNSYFEAGLTGSVTGISDRRCKTDIEDLSEKYIDFFDCLSAKSFMYNNDNDTQVHTGFIAQDIMAALDQVGLENSAIVSDINGDGSEYGLRYTEFTAILTAKIKQLENKIKNLEEQIYENNGN